MYFLILVKPGQCLHEVVNALFSLAINNLLYQNNMYAGYKISYEYIKE